jgi:hypothetical protein
VPAAAPEPIKACPHQVAIASCAASGTQTAVNSPARCSFARLDGCLRSVLIRSPGRFGIKEGAMTTQSCPAADNWRWMP